MKKLSALILVLATAGLVACGSGSEEPRTGYSGQTEQSQESPSMGSPENPGGSTQGENPGSSSQ